MVLKSSRKNTLKQIGIICVFVGIVGIVFWGICYGSLIGGILGATLIPFFAFSILALAILPYDVKADDKKIYIHKFIKKYNVSFNDIKTVELYMGPNAPMLRITKYNEESIIQAIGIMSEENIGLLISIFKSHNIEIHNTKLNP